MSPSRATCLALSLLAASCVTQLPASAADFYAGKNLNLIVGSGPGGGFDIYGRTVGRFLVKHIPGNPNLVVQNMPGAGSMKATEYIFSIAPKDGATIAIVFPGAIVEPLISGRQNFRFDPPKLEYLGSANSGSRLCITFHTSKVKSMEDAQKIPVSFGGSAPGDATTDYAQMFNALAGTKFKIVKGYKSTAAILIAVERGEVDGLCGFDSASLEAQRPAWYGTKLANMIVQASLEPKAELTKLGVPHIWNYITGENRKVAELILAQQEFHRPFIAPPGTNPAQMAVLRQAFDATMKDKEFLAAAEKVKIDIAPKSGATVAALVKQMYDAPANLVERAKKALRP